MAIGVTLGLRVMDVIVALGLGIVAIGVALGLRVVAVAILPNLGLSIPFLFLSFPVIQIAG